MISHKLSYIVLLFSILGLFICHKENYFNTAGENVIATTKYEIIKLPSNRSFFQYCDSNIGLFPIAPCKVITLNPFCILLGIGSLLLF